MHAPRRPPLSLVCVACLKFAQCVSAETLAYWEFDTFTSGTTPAAVGGAAMALRAAGGGDDFELGEKPVTEHKRR